MLQIQRHIYMGDMAGRPLGYGLAYFGEPDKDPKTYPIPTFFDKKGLIVAPEKIVVKSGFLYHNGNVVQVYAGRPNVSLLVEDKRGRQLGYFPQVAVPVIDGNGTDGNGGGGSGGGSGSGSGSGHGLGSGGGSGGGHGGVIVGSSDLPSVEQILDLLAEQISNDQLHKDLATSIAKIEPLNVDIDAIKAKIPDITQDIENAKAELAEAVASINAQRERITTANVNIEALDSAVKSLNLQLPIFSSRMTSAQNQLSQAVERINADKELINNNIRDIGTLTQKSETAKQEIAVLRTQKGELASSIEQVNTTLSNAQETIAQQITNLQSQLDGNVAKIDGVKQAITNYQASIATQIEQVQSKFQIGITATQANLDKYKQTQATEKEALTNLISTLDGAYKRADGVLTARIAQEEIARANADNANAQKIATLESKTKDTDSKIAILEQTQTTQQSALAESTRQINAKTDGVQANLEVFQQAQASKNEATAQSINSLQSRADNLSGQVNDIISSQANQHETLVQRIDSVSAEYTRADGNLSTRIANEERARADGDNANASKVSALESKTNETNSKLSQLESTQSSQYQSIATRIDGLQAAYKKADTDLTAKVATEVTARTQADEVLSTRIAALDTAYKQSDADITARLAREEATRANADNANAQAVSNLQSTVNGINGRVGTSESKIGTLERTTANTNQALATAQSQLNARFDNLAVGGRNLLKHTQRLNQLWRFASRGQGNSMTVSDGVARLIGVGSTWKHLGYDINKATAEAWLKDGTTFTLSVYAKKISGNPRLSVALRKGITGGFRDNLVGRTFDLSDDWQKLIVSGTMTTDDLQYLFVRFEFWGDGVVELKKPKLEYGNVATDWTPAPEDVQANIDTAKTETLANINTVRETLTNADTALSQRIDSLTADYNGNKSSIASQLKTLSDKDKSTASQISQITANVTNAQNKADTADVKATQAKADIIAEQKARADAESSLARQMSALDSKFTTADNAIKASVAQAQQTATNAHQALATAQNQLNAKIDGISVGGRNLIPNTTKGNTGERYQGNGVYRAITDTRDYTQIEFATINNADDTVYTLSFWAKASIDDVEIISYFYNPSNTQKSINSQGRSSINRDGRSTFKLTTEWQKYWVTWTQAKNDVVKKVIVARLMRRSDSPSVFIASPKLETGTIATDWSPAPEDVQADINSKANTASLDEYKSAQASKNEATAQRIAALDAAYKLADTTLTARLAHEEQTRASANAALTQILDSLRSEFNGNKASIDNQLRTLSEKDKAQAQKLSQLESSLGTKADAAALNSLTTKVSQVEGRINAEASKYSTLQTTVGQHTASIQQHSQSINGLKAQWTVKVESGGVVAGIGLVSSNGKSRFAIRADVLDVVSPDGTKRPMFSVLTRSQTINGVSVPKGVYLDSAYIANGSIDIAKINKASIQSLSALSANIGHFKSAQTGARLEIKDSVLLVYDANNVLRVRLGLW